MPFRLLSLDLEASDHFIGALAGISTANDSVLTFPGSGQSVSDAIANLDDLARGVEFVLGHNLIAFDLPILEATDPTLHLLQLPAVDTLRLNPLAFPRNPYHHLVKQYQDGRLTRGQINVPELDARLVIDLFGDQLAALRRAPADLLIIWHWLTALDNGAGFDRVFSFLRGAPKPSADSARAAIWPRLAEFACVHQARSALANATEHPWPLAFALAWMSVSGGNSVMPPWVWHQFPRAGRLVQKFRDTACTDDSCAWCRERHDAGRELHRWFKFPGFRPEPSDSKGRSAQQTIVEAALAGTHVLGILPTGAGKSLCYQLPALSRYDKTGALTVVISPLVALMADQVSGLEAKGIDCAVTINGLLSMPERTEALDRVRLGDAGILIISPEQLRSVAVRRVLGQRQIGSWVLDEAHCLSKWGHDFRPDYRYIGRFILERAGTNPIPPLLCLTATATPDVKTEIVEYFRTELGQELEVIDGGAHRTNLEFIVVPTTGEEKFASVHQIIEAELPEGKSGGAIVYCATRRRTEEIAEFLKAKGMNADFFHAGLLPESKKNVQQSFIRGDLRAIVATNAFGMGIDKPDVRVVIHADIPGSLENYIQETGRGGRDQQLARCVLLYTSEDVERQFGLSAMTRLSRREIHGVLRALRNLDRKKRLGGRVVATAREIIGADEGREFEADPTTDNSRIRTSISWLEEAELLRRDENRVQVFPASLQVGSASEAQSRLDKVALKPRYRRQLLDLVTSVIEADPDEGISTDELMAVSGLSSERVRAALYELERLSIVSNDAALTAFVHSGVQWASRQRLDSSSELESGVIALLREMAPDMETGDAYPFHIRIATQKLKDHGHTFALPEQVRRILRGIAGDGRGESGGGGSLDIRSLGAETIRLTLRREWALLEETAALRRAAANTLLDHLLACLPRGSRGTDLLVETTLGQLYRAIESDLILKTKSRKPDKLMERALLWLHEQEIIRLNKGLTVFRPAMTIHLEPVNRGFSSADFKSLEIHYAESVRQIHVMAEYAEKGLGSMADALAMAMDYFGCARDDFFERWFPNKEKEISRQTTAQSWQAVVESLKNPVQRRIVADDREQTSVLVLAGPGSGKTRVLVHRIAYLIRIRRTNPKGILALAYNRHAASEIRRRLAELIGDDARGVKVFTCHGLAMRLVGASFSGRASQLVESDFREVLNQAVDLLRGEGLSPEDADESRSQLLAGYRWILVDEYQDIGPDQYALISALAGRTLAEEADKISLFAVGDDDQNIYAFNGSSVEFIRRFEADYGARPAYLTDNYRSTAHISRQRMKSGRPIQVDRRRRRDFSGGIWAELDPVGKGRVQILHGCADSISQAQAAVSELQRLARLDPDWDWSKCAVIAREWRYLEVVRSCCQFEGIPAQLGDEDFSGVWRLRETNALLSWVRNLPTGVVSAGVLTEYLARQSDGPWSQLLAEAIDEFHSETGDAETTVASFEEWLAEWAQAVRRRQNGLLLLTAHRAKGLEFDHVVVLDGGWGRIGRNEDVDAARRLYYVAMTRARKTLALMRMDEQHPLLNLLVKSPAVLQRKVNSPILQAPELLRNYRRLSLKDVFLSFAGYQQAEHPVHHAISKLAPGDSLRVRNRSARWELLDRGGIVVGQLAASVKPPEGFQFKSATVFAIVVWRNEQSDPNYRERIVCDEWEVVVPELIIDPVTPAISATHP